MKIFIGFALIVSTLAICSGCISFGADIYGTRCVNIGSRAIQVHDFKLYQSRQFAVVVCGELLPGQQAGSSPYSRKPDRQVTATWKMLDTGEEISQTVPVALPDKGKDFSLEVMFYFDSDNKKVYVAYKLYDVVSDKMLIVDSQGKPFDLAAARAGGGLKATPSTGDHRVSPIIQNSARAKSTGANEMTR